MHPFRSKWRYLGIFVCVSGVLAAHVSGQQSAVLVANSGGGNIVRYNGLTGEFEGMFVKPGSGGLGSECLTSPASLVIGPDGHLYVGSGGGTDVILRYDGQTAAFMDVFVSDGSGGLDEPSGMVFGPDGNLYVSSKETDEVLRYNGTTGAFIDAFASAGSGGLDEPFGLTFGPDGNLYVNSVLTETVIRYNAATGAFIDVFADDSVIDFYENIALVFGPDGNLYVSSAHPGKVVRFDGTTGAPIDEFLAAGVGGMVDPIALRFGPDGHLYVLDYALDNVLRFDGTTGALIDTFVATDDGGLRCGYDFVFTTLPAPSCPPTLRPNVDPISPTKNRYLSFTGGNPGELTAIRVTFDALPPPFDVLDGAQAYVGEPSQVCENAGEGPSVDPNDCSPAPGLPSPTFWAATLACQPHYAYWSQSGTVHVYHEAFIPGGVYSLQAIDATCGLASEANFSLALALETAEFGDVVSNCATDPCGPPDGSVDVTTDVTALLNKFKNLAGAPTKARCDLEPSVPDLKINISDVTLGLNAFKGLDHPFVPGAAPCP